nr:keratin, type II cytoskeletal 2 epidermal-like [Aegilops tauschii subsp. strangulata]
MGTVVEKVQSAKSGLNEAFTSLLTGFEASLLAASAKDAEVSELQQKLKLADDEIDRINKRFDEAQDFNSCAAMCMIVSTATEVETLKSALAEAQEGVRRSKAAEEIEAEQVTHRKCEVWVTEVDQALQDAANRCEALEEQNKVQAAELAKALQEAKEARYALLNRLWSTPDAFADLPKSAADAAQYFWAQEGNATEKLFWSQYLAPERPALLNNQMMQLAELHRMSDPAGILAGDGRDEAVEAESGGEEAGARGSGSPEALEMVGDSGTRAGRRGGGAAAGGTALWRGLAGGRLGAVGGEGQTAAGEPAAG